MSLALCSLLRHFASGHTNRGEEKNEDLEYLAAINYEILELSQLPHQIFAKWVNETENVVKNATEKVSYAAGGCL